MNETTAATPPQKPSNASQTDAAVIACLYELEKAQLARFIHDGLAQQLTVANLELSLWEHDMREESELTIEGARAKIAHLSELVASMMGGARSISAGLRPRSLDSFGLGAALEALVGKLSARIGIKCRFNEHGEGGDLPADRSIHLYRVIEAILAGIEIAPAAGVLVELRKKRSTMEVAIAAQPLPNLSAEALARLRAFHGRSLIKEGILTITFPLT